MRTLPTKVLALITCFICYSNFNHQSFAQAHNVSSGYHQPTDPLVLANLEKWQDLKFGLFMHWGTYSQWGVVESWNLCPEDEDWIKREAKHGESYPAYVNNYQQLQKTFNPVDFDPQKWANAAKAAGMKYVVFTTKHHDGFAMFDTKQSDYKITSAQTPFSAHPRANITKEIFDTFRKDGFKIGAYFSKPDWHSENYWWPYFPPKDRNVNYDPKKYPERWTKFKDFTFKQLNELTSDYGKIDILWLDGGWVRTFKHIDTNIFWQKNIKFEQDIDMDRIGNMARLNQPGIIIVDRTVPGKWENYVTPEQAIPDQTLNIPWESCITMGDSFSYVPNDRYKPTKTIIETLIKIIARGGNYLLNIAPGPNGDFDAPAYERLKEIAAWMNINESAIFGSRAIQPYQEGNYFYTASKNGHHLHVFHLSDGAAYQQPTEFKFSIPTDFSVKTVEILGTKEKIRWQQKNQTLQVYAPKANFNYATVLKITKK